MSKLGEFIKLQGGYAFKSSELSDQKIGYPVIKIANVTGGNFIDLSKYQSISAEIASKAKLFITKSDDILIAMTGANVGRVARVSKEAENCFINQRVGRFVLKENCPYSSDFIYYLVSSEQSYNYFSRIADGAAQPNISGKMIESLDIPDISVELANFIGGSLKQLDQKTQLNTQTNQTLEQIAQAMFKSWFVDFDPVKAKIDALANGGTHADAERAAMQIISGKTDAELTQMQQTNLEAYKTLEKTTALFPSEMVESELGEVPKGWGVNFFKQITELYIDNRGKTPPTEDNGIPLLEVKHLPENRIFPAVKDTKHISEETYKSWLRQKVQPLDVIISTVGTIGRISLIPFNQKVAIAQNILGFRFNKNITNQCFMFYQMKSKRFNDDLNARLVETVQKSIKRKDLETIPLLIPNCELQKEFEKIVMPLILRQDNIESENLSLIRDKLLPKLLSGEINI